jgi:folate-dependent phosphoribosylglycinamide formyltransferase PurN
VKIVCFIGSDFPLIYFVNRINREYPVSLVVIEKGVISSNNIFSKIKKHGAISSLNVLKSKIFKRKPLIFDYDTIFGNKWQSLDKNIEYLEVDSINSKIVLNRLKEIKPDLILDHGTSIVKDHLLDTSKLALNLHWGLSPYYRGVHCTDWALINWDPYNIGVTIHRLTQDIDGGDVLVQRRAEIKVNDTVHSINMRLTYLGTELILEVINKLINDEFLNFKKQDFSMGYLTYQRQWNSLLAEEILYIERNNLIELMLNKPSRVEKMPIVEFNEYTTEN